MTGGFDFILLNLTNNAAYLTEVSRFDNRIDLRSFEKLLYPSGTSFFDESPNTALNDSFRPFLSGFLREKSEEIPIVVTVPTSWGQVKVLPNLGKLQKTEEKRVWNLLLEEAFANETALFNLNFLRKDGEETWCIGLKKVVAEKIDNMFPAGFRKNITIVLDMILYQAYYENFGNQHPAIYIAGDKNRECWYMDAVNNKSEFRLIFPESGFSEITYHKSLEDFIMFLEKKYGQELEKIYLVDSEFEGKILAEAFGDRLLRYNAINLPSIAEYSENLLKGLEKRLIENILIKTYSAASLIN
jgi:hypothetical protein